MWGMNEPLKWDPESSRVPAWVAVSMRGAPLPLYPPPRPPAFSPSPLLQTAPEPHCSLLRRAFWVLLLLFAIKTPRSSFPLWFLLFYFIIPAILGWEELQKRFLPPQTPEHFGAIADFHSPPPPSCFTFPDSIVLGGFSRTGALMAPGEGVCPPHPPTPAPRDGKSKLSPWGGPASGGHGHRRCWPPAGPGCRGGQVQGEGPGRTLGSLAAGKIIHEAHAPCCGVHVFGAEPVLAGSRGCGIASRWTDTRSRLAHKGHGPVCHSPPLSSGPHSVPARFRGLQHPGVGCQARSPPPTGVSAGRAVRAGERLWARAGG